MNATRTHLHPRSTAAAFCAAALLVAAAKDASAQGWDPFATGRSELLGHTPQAMMAAEMQSVQGQLSQNLTDQQNTLQLVQQAYELHVGVDEDDVTQAEQDVQDAQDAVDAFSSFMQDLSMGGGLHHYPIQDGTSGDCCDTSDPTAYYVLGNQAPFSVKLGPVDLRFAGARVGISIGSSGTPHVDGISVFSGWLPDMSVRLNGTNDKVAPFADSRSLLKGDLYVDAYQTTTSSGRSFIYRYRWIDPEGNTHVFSQTPIETAYVSTAAPPTSFWSTEDQFSLDVSNACMPVVRYPNGTVEEFHAAGIGFGWDPQYTPKGVKLAGPNPAAYGSFTCATTTDLRRIDRNGNVVRFGYPDANTRTKADPRGRVVTLSFVASPSATASIRVGPLLSTVTTPGPGGVPQVYRVNWTSLSVVAGSGNLGPTGQSIAATAFSDITVSNQLVAQPQHIDLVSSIVLPDGRSYSFNYGPWGNLTRVADPNGAVQTYQYGTSGSANAAYAAAAVALFGPAAVITTGSTVTACSSNSTLTWTADVRTLQAYGVTAQTVYPQGDGAGQPAYTTTIAYRKVDVGTCNDDPAGAATAGPQCCTQVWKQDAFPDGTVHKTAVCAVSPTYAGADGVSPHAWQMADEVWASGGAAPIQASYFGDPVAGTLNYGYEVGPKANANQCASSPNIALDQRTNAIRHLTDGLTSTWTYSYGDLLSMGGGVTRNSTNRTAGCLWAGSAASCASGTGTKLTETDTSYHHDANYDGRNLRRLISGLDILDGGGNVVQQTSFNYDEFALAASQQPGLDSTYTNAYRGNVTTSTQYAAPATSEGPVSVLSYYFDNGAVQRTRLPNDAAANRDTSRVSAFNFGLCSANATISSTVLDPMGRGTTSTSDCYSDQVLSVIDVNQQVTCRQYDGLGHQVEMAQPGDSLSAQPLCSSTSAAPAACYVRDTAHCQASGAAIGNGGAGPTNWTEYFPFGLGGVGYGAARTVVHAKDGTASGRYVKTFRDGLNRVVETCTKIDPATTAGAGVNDEVCKDTVYDSMARAYLSHVPFFAKDTVAAVPATSAQFTQTCFDALGRPSKSAFIFAGTWACGSVPPSTSHVTATAYGHAGNNSLVTVTDPSGNDSATQTDLMGNAVESDVYFCASSPCSAVTGRALKTTMTNDVLGRLLTTTDAVGSVITIKYDGLGRKTDLFDPDMGHWTYRYDANGNLISQTDARTQTINLYYDALNRLVVKDLPPAGRGIEDEVFTYDGTLPTCAPIPCTGSWSGASTDVCCDDRAGGSTCDPATVTCKPAGSACGTASACTPGATRNVSCGNCGSEVETCSSNCQWTLGACSSQGVCTPGLTRSLSCGNCGSEIDTCSTACQWAAGACTNQGCAPGSQRTLACGNCGSEVDTCSSSCAWTSGACTNQGVCAPGTTRSEACNSCGNETDTCSSVCQWTLGACNGNTSLSESCDPNDICGTCTGTCTPGTQTCQSNGTWTSCTPSLCDPGTTTCTTNICLGQ